MPAKDKTGPEGKGPMTGKRMGMCTGKKDKSNDFDAIRHRRRRRGGSPFRNRQYGFGQQLKDI